MEKLLLRVAEAAELASVSRSMAYELIARGQWPSVRVGSALRVPLAELRRWVEAQTQQAQAGGQPDRRDDAQQVGRGAALAPLAEAGAAIERCRAR